MKKLTANFKTKKMLAFFMALVMALTVFPLYAFATVESGAGKQSGTSEGNPFTPGQPSEQYRIPQIVTLDDGTLVAQADARWNGGMDGGGNDSMVAYSTNGGATWNWQLVTYYPDNGDVFDPSSTSICDSALATDGKTVYSLSTFFPAGYAINSASADNRPVADTAFDGDNRLRLSRTGESGYGYYIDLNTLYTSGTAQVYSNVGTPVSGYTVDQEFYLYKDGQNTHETLFYSDCEFQTVKTTFLVFRSSSDGGKTWGPMRLLNVKNSNEQFYGVGPGRGVVAADGTIIFGCYKWNQSSIIGIDNSSSTQRSSFIYSKDGGQTWNRTSDVPELMTWLPYGTWSSECQPVVLDDGTVRLFMRSARPRVNYIDAVWNGSAYVWNGDPVSLDLDVNGGDFTITENNQYSVIPYSKQVLYNGDYYKMLIVSHANNGSDRANGTLTFLLMDDNNNFVHASQTQISGGFFGYSCLTEYNDGQIALLYENAAAAIAFMPIENLEVTSGYTIPDISHTYNVNLAKNDQQTYTVSTNQITNSAENVVSASFEPKYTSTASTGSDANFDGEDVMLTDALYTFTQAPDNQWYIGTQGVYLTIGTDGQPSTKDRAPVTILNNSGLFQFVDQYNEALYMYRSGGSAYTFDQTTAYDAELGENSNGDPDADREGTLFRLFRPANPGEDTSSNPVPGYVEVDRISDGGKYLIGCDIGNEWYFLYPSYQPDNIYTHTVKLNTGADSYVQDGFDMTVTALAAGTATIVSGKDTYIIEVSDYSREITGVVNYDPVIYTHGGTVDQQSEIVSYGSNISNGSVQGEKITKYTVTDGYTIIGIDAVDAYSDNQQPLENSDISAVSESATTGHLDGTLQLANNGNYNSFESGTYVTLKTTLREESTGLVWTQTDRLYVASNPVPGHVIAATRSGDGGITNQYNLPLATYLLAEGSYGNTTYSYNFNGSGYYVGNVQKLFPEDGIMSFDGDNGSDSALTSIFDYRDDLGEFKGAGVLSFWYHEWSLWNGNNGSKEQKVLSDGLLDNTTIAYYYYDKSSDKNEGVTANSSDLNQFSIQVSRMPVDTEYKSDGNWSRNIVIGAPDSAGVRSYVDKLSGDGTIQRMEYQFGSQGTYNLPNPGDTAGLLALQRTATINCTTNVQPNQTTSMRGIVRYQEGGEGKNVSSWNDVRLTFEIRMCDKTNERTPYEEATNHVEKSTWYTTSTWANYMNALLIRQEYLNNYTLLTTAADRTTTADENDTYEQYIRPSEIDGQDSIEVSYQYLQKRADFSPLEDALEDSEEAYESGIQLADGSNYTPDSYKAFLKAYNDGLEFMEDYQSEDVRNNTGGYVLTPTDDPNYIMGPDVDTNDDSKREQVQIDIDTLADAIINNQPVTAADDDVYVAAKDESEKIDMTAYEDNGGEIKQTIWDGDTAIYEEYEGVQYVNLPSTSEGQAELDSHTTALLTNMNIGSGASSPQVKQFHVDYTLDLDGSEQDVQTVEGKADYYYGETAHIDLTSYASDEYTVMMTVTSESGGKDPTTYNLADLGYVVPILIQEDTVVDVEVYTNEVLTVEDYYGTVIGTAYINPVDGTQVDIFGKTISIGSDTVATVKENPKYTFAGWTIEDGSHTLTEATVIRQNGILNAGADKVISVIGGTVNGRDSFATPYFNEKLTLESENANYWTRVVGGHIYLASYDPSFVNFTSNEEVVYHAYTDTSELPDYIIDQIANDVPAVYGTGYFIKDESDEKNSRFTLSCDYSAPEGVTVLEAGIICSRTDDASTDETLRKGQEGAYTVPANRIAHWNNNSTSSGTYTMTLNNSASGTYYMRAYVSYAKDYISDGEPGSISVPYVAYCERIFKCENGIVTAVN